MSAVVLAAGAPRRPVNGWDQRWRAVHDRQQHSRVGVRRSREKPGRGRGDAGRDGVDQNGRPEGLAGPTAEEVLECPSRQRGV